MNKTLIALAAAYTAACVLPMARRPNLSWSAYVGAGGPCTANRKPARHVLKAWNV